MNIIKDDFESYKNKSDEIIKKLTADTSKDIASMEVQQTIKEWIGSIDETTRMMNIDMGENYYDLVIEGYLSDEKIIEVTDKLYGVGASKFIWEFLKYYFD